MVPSSDLSMLRSMVGPVVGEVRLRLKPMIN